MSKSKQKRICIQSECIVRDELKEQLERKQAKIDSLMLEYCPDEMTKEQMDNWAKHQKPVDIPLETLG